MFVAVCIVCIVLFIIGIISIVHDERKNEMELVQQLYDNRVTFKDCVHFYCHNCDVIFHIKQKTCNTIRFSNTLTVYYGKCPKCNKTCKVQRGR